MSLFYTSRTAIETAFECKRKRWLGYLWSGKGLTQAQANIPFTTGTCVHEGIGFLLRNVKNGIITSDAANEFYLSEDNHWVDDAVQVALEQYTKIVKESGILVNEKEDRQFVFAQECARTEALVRCWAIAELPKIVKYYHIYSVEDEIVVPFGGEVVFQARVDAILQDKEMGRMYNYSLKTMKDYRGERTDRGFALALQTITEAWAAQEHLKSNFAKVRDFMSIAGKQIVEEKRYQSLASFVDKYMQVSEQRIYGTRHCFLIKGGKSRTGEDDSNIAGDSPLIRGYRKSDEDANFYCHSYYYPNTNNRSGKGSIGKSWQGFNVWEEMTIKEWIKLLNSKVQDHTGQIIPEIQPECGDIIKQQVVTPPETFTNKEVMESTIRQITVFEGEIRGNAGCVYPTETFGEVLDITFPMNRQSCLWPTCEFLPICHLKDWKGESVSRAVREDPVGSGLYKIRVPHHKPELEAMKK